MPATRKTPSLDKVSTGELDVGKLFVDTKQIYLDARANAAEFDEPGLRVHAMYSIVKLLGYLIIRITAVRLTIMHGEVGLKGFDADLAGLKQRYRNLYRPFFDDLAPPAQWTAEQWSSLEEDLEGPILLWDLKTCRERWGIAFASPPCEGPDLLMALSLVHQLGAAQALEQELIASVYGLLDISIEEIGEHWSEQAKKAGQAMSRAYKAIADKAKDYFADLPVPKSFERVAWAIGATVVIGGGGYLWLKTRK